MTTQSIAILLAMSAVKGILFGMLFAWMFPPANRWLAHKLGRDTGPLPSAEGNPGYYIGLGSVSGGGFALLDFLAAIAERNAMPDALRWAVGFLYLVSIYGCVVLVRAQLRGSGQAQAEAPKA